MQVKARKKSVVPAIRRSNRDKLLETGLAIMHKRGFIGASVRDIVHAAGVSQGSFTDHFPSKEAFSLEILNLYFEITQKVIEQTLRNDSMKPLKRLEAYIDAHTTYLEVVGKERGCLYGNFAAEASGHSEVVRKRLVEIFAEIQKAITYCLEAAVKARELPRDFDSSEVARFIFFSLQGAMLIGKGQRSLAPSKCFKEILFSKVLC
jgi:TetR/AcrR family transcriptional regulator, transcriptional repressor for nem operon